MDIWIKPDEANATKVMTVLENFGFGELDLTIEDFTKLGNVIQLGYPPRCALIYLHNLTVWSLSTAILNA